MPACSHCSWQGPFRTLPFAISFHGPGMLTSETHLSVWLCPVPTELSLCSNGPQLLTCHHSDLKYVLVVSSKKKAYLQTPPHTCHRPGMMLMVMLALLCKASQLPLCCLSPFCKWRKWSWDGWTRQGSGNKVLVVVVPSFCCPCVESQLYFRVSTDNWAGTSPPCYSKEAALGTLRGSCRMNTSTTAWLHQLPYLL